jgi:hypothetical protein
MADPTFMFTFSDPDVTDVSENWYDDLADLSFIRVLFFSIPIAYESYFLGRRWVVGLQRWIQLTE